MSFTITAKQLKVSRHLPGTNNIVIGLDAETLGLSQAHGTQMALVRGIPCENVTELKPGIYNVTLPENTRMTVELHSHGCTFNSNNIAEAISVSRDNYHLEHFITTHGLARDTSTLSDITATQSPKLERIKNTQITWKPVNGYFQVSVSLNAPDKFTGFGRILIPARDVLNCPPNLNARIGEPERSDVYLRDDTYYVSRSKKFDEVTSFTRDELIDAFERAKAVYRDRMNSDRIDYSSRPLPEGNRDTSAQHQSNSNQTENPVESEEDTSKFEYHEPESKELPSKEEQQAIEEAEEEMPF